MISPIIDSFVRLICKCLILLISNINSPFPEEHNTYVGEQQRTFCYRKLPFLHFSSDVNIEKKRNSGWVRSELVHQGQMQCQYWLCKSSDFFPDFVDNFPDFSPISLPYFPIFCKLTSCEITTFTWSVSAPVHDCAQPPMALE